MDELYAATWRDVQAKAETLCSDRGINCDDKADATATIQIAWLNYCRKYADRYSNLSAKHQRHLQWRLCKLRLIDWMQSETIRGRGRTDSLDSLLADREFDETRLSCEMTLPDDDSWMTGLDIKDHDDMDYAIDCLTELGMAKCYVS